MVETELVQDPLLRLFSVEALLRPGRLWDGLLTTTQQAILIQLCSEVEQFRRKPGLRMRFTDYEEMMMSLQESIEKLLKGLPTEERIKGLAPEELLKGMAAEERLKGLSAEDLERLRILLNVSKN